MCRMKKKTKIEQKCKTLNITLYKIDNHLEEVKKELIQVTSEQSTPEMNTLQEQKQL